MTGHLPDGAAAPASAVLADDEPQLLAYLEKLLQGCWPQLEIVGRAANGEQALQMIRTLRPDVAFLDIQMPGLSGLDVAAQLAAPDAPPTASRSGPCRLVFVTAFDQYAIEAFERAAVDYLLKPVTAERLASTVERLRASPGPADGALGELRRMVESLRREPAYLHWLQVSVKDEITLLPVAHIDLFQSSDKYTLACNGQGEWLLRTALKDLEPQLDPQAFWRIHRNAIVRVAAIARVSRDLRGQFIVQLKGQARKLAVSRPYAHLFRAL